MEENLKLTALPYVQKAIISELYIPIKFRDKVKPSLAEPSLETTKSEDTDSDNAGLNSKLP